MAIIEQTATDLYRYWDMDDRLLYVGISFHAAVRASEHRRSQGWWADVDRMTVERHPDRESARAAELEAIRNEHPLHNIADKPAISPVDLTWSCEICDKPILGLAGYLELPRTESNRYIREMREWREDYSHLNDDCVDPTATFAVIDMHAAFNKPKLEHWWAIHQRCDPNIDATGYHLTIDRISTMTDAMDWTCHLNGKRWLHQTDWFRLMKQVVTTPTDIRTTRSLR